MFLVILFEIPVEISFDLFSFFSLGIGADKFMDISNTIGGLGILGVRALLLTGRRIDNR
jgi:hypothetical protein